MAREDEPLTNDEWFSRELAALQRRQQRWNNAYRIFVCTAVVVGLVAALAFQAYREWLIWTR